MAYLCLKCRQPIDLDKMEFGIRCDKCGCRVLMKQHPTTVRKVRAV